MNRINIHKQSNDHAVNNNTMFGGQEELILRVFDDASRLLDQETEHKILANELLNKPLEKIDEETDSFIRKYASQKGYDISATIKYILKKNNYIPSKANLNKADIEYLQKGKDGILTLRDNYYKQSHELSLTEGSDRKEKIIEINEKIRKLTFVVKALTIYIREYNKHLLNILAQEK